MCNNKLIYKPALATKKPLNSKEGKGVCINCSFICRCFMVVRKKTRNRSLKYFANASFNKAKMINQRCNDIKQ